MYFFSPTKWNVVAVVYWWTHCWIARDSVFILDYWDHISWLRSEEIVSLINKYLRSICLIPVITEHAAASQSWLANHATGNRWHTVFHNSAHTHTKKKSKDCARQDSVSGSSSTPELTPNQTTCAAVGIFTLSYDTGLVLTRVKTASVHSDTCTLVTSRRGKWYFMVSHALALARTCTRTHTAFQLTWARAICTVEDLAPCTCQTELLIYLNHIL